ncbi:MAG: hypothetical protein JNM21_00640 [Taibaiella sp.]|nr:hypothetical protein [Taibaiella sp.]
MKAIVWSGTLIFFLLFTGSITYEQVFGIPIEKIDTAVFIYLEDCGNDDAPTLNNAESSYLNAVMYRYPKRPFDFSHKSIAFVTGSSGKTISGKQAYFNTEKKRLRDRDNRSLNGGQLVVFNELEKQQSGGYDAVIVYWSKLLATKKGLIKLLNKQAPQQIKS